MKSTQLYKITKRTRFKVTIFVIIALLAVVVFSIFKATEMIGAAAIGGIITTGGGYLWGETSRPSGLSSNNEIIPGNEF